MHVRMQANSVSQRSNLACAMVVLVASPDLSIMLSQPQPVLGLHSCPHIANVFLHLPVAPSDPRGVLKEGYESHEGIIGFDHACHNAKGQDINVVRDIPANASLRTVGKELKVCESQTTNCTSRDRCQEGKQIALCVSQHKRAYYVEC